MCPQMELTSSPSIYGIVEQAWNLVQGQEALGSNPGSAFHWPYDPGKEQVMNTVGVVPKVAIQSSTSSHFQRNKQTKNLYFPLEGGWVSQQIEHRVITEYL